MLELSDESLKDEEIFEKARNEKAIVITKDFDFVNLVNARGAPPQVLMLSVGNCTNKELIEILRRNFAEALKMLKDGHIIVEMKKTD